jgi:predicted nucleic acid-binding protein
VTPAFVLDAWSILAWLQGEEPAAGRVRELLLAGQNGEVDLAVTRINLGEVYYCVGRRKGRAEADRMLADLQRLPLRILPAVDALVMAAARLKMEHALAYADAFAVAAAQHRGATLVTGDPEMEGLGGVVTLEFMRRHSRPRRSEGKESRHKGTKDAKKTGE